MLKPGYNQGYWCSFLDFSMRELDGLKVWDGFELFSFNFKIADSEPSVLREALKPVLFFLPIPMCHMARTANKVQLGVFLQYPTFNWVSFTHIHRGIIYRESYTRIPLYLILCNNIVNCFLLCTSRKLLVTLFKEMSNIFTVKGFILVKSESFIPSVAKVWIGFHFRY